MYFTGFADEAARGIDGQIKATKELGWENIESRHIDGNNIHNISDEDFDIVYGKLQDSGVKINCFGSAIANWAKKIDEPIDASLEETKRAIPRMKKLGTEMVRIMSFAVLKDRAPDDQMEEERFERLRLLCGMFIDEGLLPVHENCMNYGGMGWTYTQKLIENVPGMKLVFDTGNPVFTDDFTKEKPYPKQSAWEFYSHVKEHVAYIHIKDQNFESDVEGQLFPKARFTFPGEGDGDVKQIVKDLVDTGYDGGISIEPHLAAVFHEGDSGTQEDVMYSNYVEYGRRMEAMVASFK
jgi:sugar phosphate isomerase/epimerase